MAPNLPRTMLSWQYTSTKNGLEENLTLNTIPIPQPTASQHLVKIHTAALNPVDYRLSESPLIHKLCIPKPASPGDEFAGTIVQPAPGSGFKEGDRVFGAVGTNFMCGGAMSEYGVCSVKTLAALPEDVSMVDAAGITVAGVTVYQAIVPYSKVGDRVFLNGGSGGVGTFGIQIAKAAGRVVDVCCSGANAALCKELGADQVIDYKTRDVLMALKAAGRKYDLVVDLVGNDHSLYWKAHEYTNPGAKFVTVAISHQFSFIRFVAAARLLPRFLGGGGRQHLIVVGDPKVEELKQIADWMVEGKVKAVIDSKYKFGDLRQAYQRLKTGRAKGKIVVNVLAEDECTA